MSTQRAQSSYAALAAADEALALAAEAEASGEAVDALAEELAADALDAASDAAACSTFSFTFADVISLTVFVGSFST